MSARSLHVLINDQWVGTLTEENGIWGYEFSHR